MKFSISIVIPAFNESINFNNGCLNKISKYLSANKLDWEVIIVDDGSTDGSDQKIARFAKEHHWRFISKTHQGKAATVMAGMLAAANPYILFTDFDQATPLSEVEKLLPFLSQGYKIVIGSREVQGAQRQSEPLYRHLMGKVFNFVVQIVAVRGVHDTQCGFKIFSQDIAKDLFNALKVYRPKKEKYAFTGAFDVELLFIANKRKIKIAEVPIVWTHAATNRINPLRDSLRMFWHVLKIRLTDLKGGYR